MSAYTTRSITESKAKQLMTVFYAKKLAELGSIDTGELSNALNRHISDTDDWLLVNFDVIPDYDYMYADIN